MVLAMEGRFIPQDEDGDHPMRYLPLDRVYSSSPAAPLAMPKKSMERPLLVYYRKRKRKNGVIEGKRRRNVFKFELARLGSDLESAVRERRLRENGRIERINGRNGSSLSVSKKRKRDDKAVTGSAKDSSWIGKRWVELDIESADPLAFVGLVCKVFWPLDDDWYKGSVSGYSSETKQHHVQYSDGDKESLVLSRERVKFNITHDEMKILNLKCSVPGLEKNGYNELLALAVSFHDCQDLEPGDVVWAKLTGHAMWPGVVMDESNVCAKRRELKPFRVDRSILIQFFGTHDFARIKLKHAVPFLNGLLSSLHLKCKQARFYRSLDEAKLYLSTQQLPQTMLKLQKTIRYDEPRVSSDRADSCGDRSEDENVMINETAEYIEMTPIDLGSLRVTCLGRIIFNSDYFHNKKHIWPEGYTAFRKYKSTKDPSILTSYKMEVLRNPKLMSRPLFRVSSDDGVQIDGPTPSACWREIYSIISRIECKNNNTNNPVKEGKSGSYMFGFSNPQISQLIQELPNSRLCAKYFDGSGDLHLGYRAVRIDWKDLDRCSVCDMDEEYEDNLFLQCDKCRMMVHARCYGELEPLNGVLWLCNLCRPGALDSPPRCCLCPITGGAMKSTTDGRWAHLTCAMWIPETCLVDIKRMEPIDGISRISKDRWKLLCSICGVSYGACIQCSHHTCCVAYHPLCARAAGLCVELEDEEKMFLMRFDEDEEQCVRLLSFCKKHRQPTKEKSPAEESKPAGHICQPLPSPAFSSNPSGCARTEPYNFSGRRGQKQPEALTAASAKRLYVQNQPYLITGNPRNLTGRSPGCESACITGLSDSLLAVQEVVPAGVSVSSMAAKYNNMRATFRKRLAFGKSRIHGFGVFAKVAHKAGDMVIEYTGELVRPPIADIREHRIYNSLVGAGTYMFRIDDERVIDATRAGSIAHLINHSCEPNCYSRVISVLGDEHIIIFAKRDINQWEELTYDYRFFSLGEQLSCYCGFPRCRGVVNDTEAEEQAAPITVPRSDLLNYISQ